MRSRLEVIGEGEAVASIAAPTQPQPEPPNNEARLLGMLIRALTQRAIVGLAAIADLLLIGSVFALWVMIISNPTVLQLVAVCGYGLFVLVSLYLRQRR